MTGETVALSERPVLFPAVPPPSLKELHWMATALAGAVTLPDAIRGNPPAVLAVMLAGRELGIGPMAATRMVHIINGQTSIATELKLALAKQAGHDIAPFKEARGFCVVGCRRHPDADPFGWALDNEAMQRALLETRCEEFTVAAEIVQATKGGPKPLVDKDNWRNHGRSMLFWRAAGDFMRRHCPGVGGGLYTLEELGADGGD